MAVSSTLVSSGRRYCFGALIVLVSLLDLGLCEEQSVFSNSWAVEVKGGLRIADQLAEKHGFINRGLVRKTINCISKFISIQYFYRLVVLKMCIIFFISSLPLELAGASRHSTLNITTLLLRNK